MNPRPGSIPDTGLPCIQHGMDLEQHGRDIAELKVNEKQDREDIIVLKTEANSRAKSLAMLIPVVLALLSAAGTIYTLLTRIHS